MPESWLLYPLLGALAGSLAGLLGVGGGLIIVPVLAWSFVSLEMSSAHIMHLAIGTSLATIVMTSLASIRAHHRRGAVRWELFRRLWPAIAIGALVGAAIADALQSQWLRRFFGVFELMVAAQMAFGFKPSTHRELPGIAGMGVAGGIIGSVSAIVGIGGGTLTVPFLSWCNVAMREAVATSAACGLPIAVAGAIGFLLTGLDAGGLPPYSSGYLYWPALIGIAVTSVLFAPLGAALAHRLPAAGLRRIFALLLAGIGLQFLLG
ncbi:MAG: sulfite exporter TauE/SafE family protein [Gammaproteobacteria bacterium]|nr:sulfite exporter TauE/SafE family protein [Gammaproteobacteria bacterium]